MKTTRALIILLAALACGINTAHAGKETSIPLDQIPAVVLEATKKAVPGIVIEEAEVEQRKKVKVYEIEGKAQGQAYELHITEKGKLIKSAKEKDDDDEDADDGDDANEKDDDQ